MIDSEKGWKRQKAFEKTIWGSDESAGSRSEAGLFIKPYGEKGGLFKVRAPPPPSPWGWGPEKWPRAELGNRRRGLYFKDKIQTLVS